MPDTIYNTSGSYPHLLMDAVRFSRIAFAEHRRESGGPVLPKALVMHPADARIYLRTLRGLDSPLCDITTTYLGRVSIGKVDGIDLVLDSRVDLGKFFLE